MPGAESIVPGSREVFREEIDRVTLVAEARILVRQLDEYLVLIGEWAVEGTEDAD